MKCEFLSHFLHTFTSLASSTFAVHSILSFLIKIPKAEIPQRNKFTDPCWEGCIPPLEVKGELPHPKGLVIFNNQSKIKSLGLIHLSFMTWESKSPITL